MTVVFFAWGTDPRPMFSDIKEIRFIPLSPDSNLTDTAILEEGAWVWFAIRNYAVNVAGEVRSLISDNIKRI